MTVYNQLLDAVSKGKRFRINLKEKTLSINGQLVNLEYKENLITIDKEFNMEDELNNLFEVYNSSVPTARHIGNQPYFKAKDIEELNDADLAYNENRNIAQAMLEGFILLMTKLDKIKLIQDGNWFWQSKKHKEFVILKDWM